MVRTLVLALVAALWSAAAPAAWQVASSTHFVVYSEDPPDRVATFTAQLERYDKAMHVMRGLPDEAASPSGRVTVFVVKDVGAVQRLAGREMGDVAGFYMPRAEGSVAFSPRSSGDKSKTALSAQQVLLHEYAHHVTFMTFGHTALPPWFVEGFAEFNATASFDPDGGVTIGAPPLYRASNMLNADAVPLKKLLSADPDRLSDLQTDIFYGRSWLLLHYLTFEPTRSGQLSRYLLKINEGRSPAEAAAVFGNLAKLDADLNRYTRRPTLSAVTLPAAQLPVGALSVRALTPAEAATMPALIQSKRGVDGKSAPGVLAKARAAAAAWPADGFALDELAEAEFDAGHYDEARAAAVRAAAADPRSVHALMYQGMALLAVAAKAKSRDPAAWQAARHWFSVANHLDPGDPWPLAMFYRSYRAAHLPATANAQTGLLYAHQLAPFDPALGLEAAEVYLRQGKTDEAKAALKPVAFSPHGGATTAAAGLVLAALDKGGAPAALALLDRDPADAKDGTTPATPNGDRP